MDETHQLLLWRWSTIVQLSAVTMAAAFFALLARTNRRPELQWWARAWAFNLLAILVTSLFWALPSAAWLPIVSLLYVAGKSAFALLLMQGVWAMIRPGRHLFTTPALSISVIVYAAAVAVVIPEVGQVGIAQHSLLGVALVVFAIVLLRSKTYGLTWLIAGLAVRGIIAVAEAAAYILLLIEPSAGALADWVPLTGSFVSASSSLDTGAEWLIVLGCVLAVSERGRQQLENANQELISAHANLRRLADRDALTGTVNRRALRDIFNEVQGTGAMLLFFDLDGFKKINDVHGHAAGDTCLKRFANALRESFRPDDHVVRYGGDEFLVIAPSMDKGGARARVYDLAELVGHGSAQATFCGGFSVGMSELAPGGSPEAALQIADQNMYKAKRRERPKK